MVRVLLQMEGRYMDRLTVIQRASLVVVYTTKLEMVVVMVNYNTQ
jgi:hypothetical protein